LQLNDLTNEIAVANKSGAMEADTISKKRAEFEKPDE